MLECRYGGTRWRLSPLFPAMLTALLLWQPDGLAVPCVLASALHEGGHLAAMLLLGCPPSCFTLGAFGARIEIGRDRMPGYGRGMVISFSGPALNAVCGALLWWFGRPQATLVHFVLGGLNLLPAAALDGGQILRACFGLLGVQEQGERWLRGLSAAVLLPLAAAAGYLALSRRGNGTLLIVTLYLTALIFWHPE